MDNNQPSCIGPARLKAKSKPLQGIQETRITESLRHSFQGPKLVLISGDSLCGLPDQWPSSALLLKQAGSISRGLRIVTHQSHGQLHLIYVITAMATSFDVRLHVLRSHDNKLCHSSLPPHGALHHNLWGHVQESDMCYSGS